MTDLVAVLEEIGCREVRTATGDWTAVSEASAFEGETTDTVHVLVWSEKPVAVLQDRDRRAGRRGPAVVPGVTVTCRNLSQ
ncbi:hypothetical protein GGP55_003329 [Salinibacter ruber]|nr:hypothetical protein [Salinibacter ruber]